MTTMEQIEYIAVQARKKGMKYGDYVAQYGHTLPPPEKAKADAGKKTCPICGLLYKPASKKVTCCPACVGEASNESQKRYYNRKNGIDNSQAVCKRCGEPLVKTHGNQKYCMECKAEIYMEWQAEKNRRDKEKRRQAKEGR